MDDYHAKHKKYFMTKSEHDFFKLLVKILGDRYYIFPQVHIGTITTASTRWSKNWWLWRKARFFNDMYSVDYVICDTGGIKPRLVIELDDDSHKRKDRQARDRFVDRLLDEAGLPVVRISLKDARRVEFVASKLDRYLG